MATGIMYSEYETYELEGIPPYVSYALELDRRQQVWVDATDARRYRIEEHFRTRSDAAREGVISYETGTGAGGTAERCDVYDEQTTCQSKPITDTLTIDGWLQRVTTLGRRTIDNQADPTKIGGFTYKGVQKDDQWGDVHVFERQLNIQSQDLKDRPAIETQKFDVALLRDIERRRELLDGETRTLHMLRRLVQWQTLDPADVPNNLFDPKRVPTEAFNN